MRFSGGNAIITGGNTLAPCANASESLGIQDIYMGSSLQIGQTQRFYEKIRVESRRNFIEGDDIPDYEALKHVGVPTCPADVVSEIKEICCYVSHLKGGEGCGRDVIEQVLKLNGKWMHNVEAFGW